MPVTTLWMTCGAYSVAPSSKRIGRPLLQRLLVRSNSATFSSLIPMYRRSDAQPLDLLGRLEVPAGVLAGVLGRLGRVEAEPSVHVDAHPAAELGVGGDPLVEQGVEVAAVLLEPSSHAWWLTPAESKRTSRWSMPITSLRPTTVQYTE